MGNPDGLVTGADLGTEFDLDDTTHTIRLKLGTNLVRGRDGRIHALTGTGLTPVDKTLIALAWAVAFTAGLAVGHRAAGPGMVVWVSVAVVAAFAAGWALRVAWRH
jgi:hypothetical protein